MFSKEVFRVFIMFFYKANTLKFTEPKLNILNF